MMYPLLTQTQRKEVKKEGTSDYLSIIDSRLGQDRLGQLLKPCFKYLGINQTHQMLC